MKTRTHGFIIADALMAMSILGAMMALMAVGLNAHRRAALALDAARDAGNAAESALCDLQQGKPAAALRSTDLLKVEPVPGGTVVPGFTWVRVTATVDGHSESLTGLAKSAALTGG